MAFTVTGISPCAVMKMIGILIPDSISFCWTSNPPIPGRRTSNTRQLGTSGIALCRKTCAVENNSARKLTVFRMRCIARRMSSSSSTMNTTGEDKVVMFLHLVRQCESEGGTTTGIGSGPQATTVRFHNRTANCQTHTGALRFSGKERIEDAINFVVRDAHTGI